MPLLYFRAIILDMDNQISRRLPEPNLATRGRHQRQVFWQVLFPVILFTLIMVFLAVLVSLSGMGQVQRFSDISIIFLVLPSFITGILILVIFAGIIFLLARILGILPPYFRVAQNFLERITAVFKKAADTSATPVILIESIFAGMKAVFQKPTPIVDAEPADPSRGRG